VFALYVCGDCVELAQKRRDFEYYEAITVRDSTLSAPIQAIVAAEVGHLDLAYDYLRESALVDLRDLAGNTADGLHLAALSGAWLVAVAGFGGMRDHGETIAFAPRVPPTIVRLCFRLRYRGRCLRVQVFADRAEYQLLDGEPLEVLHHGERITVTTAVPRVVACPAPEAVQPIASPAGRAPLRRGLGSEVPSTAGGRRP